MHNYLHILPLVKCFDIFPKVSDDVSNYLYKQTEVSEQFDLETVHAILLSIRIKNLKTHLYSVERSEIEDVILSLHD